jgi:TolB-like protein
MTVTQTANNSLRFSHEAIKRQLDKIFRFPVFSESAILRRFLDFIVGQTLAGNENCVKEYTIAINVLGKPVHFKPQENGIVRIHAGRLRRALNRYYDESGAEDPIFISIPKGKYIPNFGDRPQPNTAQFEHEPGQPIHILHRLHPAPILAVLPFHFSPVSELLASFAEGVSMQLSTSLARDRRHSVVAFQVVKSIFERTSDIRELTEALHADIMIDGNLQLLNDRLRFNLQIIKTISLEQIWGELFERTLTSSTAFNVQDEMVRLATTVIEVQEAGLFGFRKEWAAKVAG